MPTTDCESLNFAYEGQPIPDHSFPYPSNYAEMHLVVMPDGSTCVRKIYGAQHGEQGHAMDMSYNEAFAMTDLAILFQSQLEAAGVNVATLKKAATTQLSDDIYGTELTQEYIAGPNLQDVWITAVKNGDETIMQNVHKYLLDLLFKVHSFQPNENQRDLFPSLRNTQNGELLFGIDAKPNNFIVPVTSEGNLNIQGSILVDTMYPCVLNNDTWLVTTISDKFMSKDPGWQFLTQRLGNLKGLLPKIILELAGATKNALTPTQVQDVLHHLEENTIDYAHQHFSNEIFDSFLDEIRNKYAFFQTMMGRGEKNRFGDLIKPNNFELITSHDLLQHPLTNAAEITSITTLIDTYVTKMKTAAEADQKNYQARIDMLRQQLADIESNTELI